MAFSDREKKLFGVLAIVAVAYAFMKRGAVASAGNRVAKGVKAVAVGFGQRVVQVGTMVFDAAKTAAFKAALVAATPGGRAAQYAEVVIQVSSEQQISPFLIVAVMERESHSGEALTPPGPSGTGDGGHGRGLMQLDDRTKGGKLHGAVIADGRWTDPYWNLTAAVVDHLKPDQAFFVAKGLTGDAQLRATIASYNAGPGAVWSRIQAGQDPDAATTGGDYSADVLSRLASISQAFQSRAS